MGNYIIAQNKVAELIYRNFITEEDIIKLTELNINDIYELIQNDSYIDTVLARIYLKPYILYKIIPNNINNRINVISFDSVYALAIKRYNEEKNENGYLLNEGFIDVMQYNENISQLKDLYFDSSIIGQRIKKEFSRKNKLLKKR